MSASAAIKLGRRVPETRSLAPGQIGAHRKPVLVGQEVFLLGLVERRNAITLAEIREELVARSATRVSLTTIWSTQGRLSVYCIQKVPEGSGTGRTWRHSVAAGRPHNPS